MYKKITLGDFESEFAKHARGNQFSDAGKAALFVYFEELEEILGKEMELDVVDICSNYTEYDSWDSFVDEYADYNDINEIEREYSVIRVGKSGFIVEGL